MPRPNRRRSSKRTWRAKHVSLVVLAVLVIAGMVAVAGVFAARTYKSLRPAVAPVVRGPDAPRTKVASSILGSAAVPDEPGGVNADASQPSHDEVAEKIALFKSTPVPETDKPKGPAYNPRVENVALTFTSLANDAPEVAEARAVLDACLAAPTWREKLPHVFRAARCESFMRDYYDKRGETEPQPRALISAGFIAAGDSKVVNLSFACPERAVSGLRANFHRTASGKLQLDWEAWTGFSEKAWPELKKERSSLPVLVRAIAEESDYYNYEFAEDWRWLAVKLRSPDGLHNVTGYVERNNVLGIALANLIGVPLPHKLPDGTPMPALKLPGAKASVTIRLAFPAKAQSDHCVNITAILADRWLLFPGEGK